MAKTYTLLKSAQDTIKTPQVRVILKVIEDTVGVGEKIEMLKLVELVDASPDFSSRQGAARVIRFYERPMVENGLILVEGTDRPEPLPKPKRNFTEEDGKKPPVSVGPERKASKRKKEKVEDSEQSEATEAGHAHHGHAKHAEAVAAE